MYLFDVPSLMKEGSVKSTNNKTDHLGIFFIWVEKRKLVRLSKNVKYLRCNKKQKERKKKINEDSVKVW